MGREHAQETTQPLMTRTEIRKVAWLGGNLKKTKPSTRMRLPTGTEQGPNRPGASPPPHTSPLPHEPLLSRPRHAEPAPASGPRYPLLPRPTAVRLTLPRSSGLSVNTLPNPLTKFAPSLYFSVAFTTILHFIYRLILGPASHPCPQQGSGGSPRTGAFVLFSLHPWQLERAWRTAGTGNSCAVTE